MRRVIDLLAPYLPQRLRTWIRIHARRTWPPVGMVRFGSLRRLQPIDKLFGYSRGTPIDRFYIERYLDAHSGVPGYVLGDIRGSVLEVGDDKYTKRFGTFAPEGEKHGPESGYVTSNDVLHGDASNPKATIVGDLATGEGLPSEAYDCVICAQTLPVIYDVHGAIKNLHRTLKPGGVVLITVNGVCRICRPDYELWGDYWRFTSLSMRRLLEEAFPPDSITVEAHGNVLTATAFMHGLAVEELKRAELELHDPDYEVSITARAVRES